MEITEKINKAISAYTVKTGMEVWCIYLGRTQMRELASFARKHANFEIGPYPEGKNRPEYCGALVFEVNDDDHLNVS